MQVAFSTLSKAEAYKLMNCMIVPRPIAWVTTLSDDGVVNLAPFSTFNIVCYDPPLLGMNVGRREDGSPKDSARNARLHQEMVVHIADDSLLEAVHASSYPHPPQVSESEVLALPLVPSVDVTVPRLRDAPLAIECRVSQVIEFGTSADYLVAQIVRLHAREGLLADGKIETRDLRPLARLGGPMYGALGEIMVMAPPHRDGAPARQA